ncbi:MAG: multicopper oxidase domain-containing protein [Lewinellaceae bacterium]|nr:multicopper oxidase domain-containing protein [Lewinellaceae bacterium]
MKYILTLILLVTGIQLFGHVQLIRPQGGETFTVGEEVLVEWSVVIPHNTQNWILLFSPDGGQNWETIQADISPGVLTYNWTVPDVITSQGRIQVIQDNVGSDYNDVSGDFSIEGNASSLNALFIPETLTGSSINLNLQSGQVAFYDGFITNTIGYNQDILGPTLILEKGSDVTLNVANNLSETTTLHWHGLHVSAKNDGGPHTPIGPGEVWDPTFTVLDKAGTYWYHPHLHEHTEEQVTMGAAGFIIVRDDDEAQLELPRTYGIDDFPVVIQSRAFNAEKQFLINTASDNAILCNGTLDPYLEVPAQVVRLRLLNGSTERVYNLGFSGNLNFYQIASDGGLFSAPVILSRLRLAPGERAEILLDLSALQGQSVGLMGFASELPNGIYGAANPSVMPMGSIPGYGDNPLNGSDFNILQLDVVASSADPVTTIPTGLVAQAPYLEADAQATRSLTFTPAQMGPSGMATGPFLINGAGFDMEVINYRVPLGNTEIWQLTNMTAISHPFHIHDVQFYILDINGNSPPPNMQGRKDVVLVPPMGGTVRFITKFEDFADEETPYMYHCHMLSHEDDGMMGQFIVFGNASSVDEFAIEPAILYPNPTSDNVMIGRLDFSAIEIYNSSGQILERRKIANENESINLSGYADGLYYIHVITPAGIRAFKVVKN